MMAEQGNTTPSTRHSNSPLVQLGIVSWGKGCGSFPGRIVAFLRLYHFPLNIHDLCLSRSLH